MTKFSLSLLCAILLYTGPLSNIFANAIDIKGSIVKIYTVANQPNYQEPWNTSSSQFSGSGSIIEGNKVLTNAHVIANSTFLEVKRYGQTKRYGAEVEAVSHDADLAILTLEDEAFFDGATPLTLGDLPTTQEEVIVYGFPTGGDTLSVTKGVVSRIEHQSYAHSSEYMLSVQIDAAINPGNSGGPVIHNGKISGVVMQGLRGADNIGYMVPTTTVKHFFKDMEDGKYDGFPDIGIIVQDMENPSSRKKFKLTEDQTGVLAYKILFNSPAIDAIKPGDIITAIDGHKIANDGTVEFRPKEYTSFGYYIDNHQIGDTLNIDLIRNSKPLNVDFKLTTTSKDFWLVQREQYDKFPRYFIYGGFVFTPVTKNYVNSGMSFFSSSSDLSKLLDEYPSKEKKEAVVLAQVLASKNNKGYHNLYDWLVEKVNGKTFNNFDEFHAIFKNADKEFITLENNDGYKVIIDRQVAIDENASILERYHIESAQSHDLQPKAEEKESNIAVKTKPVIDESLQNRPSALPTKKVQDKIEAGINLHPTQEKLGMLNHL
ncbi:MAG: Serine protease [uncultured Thiotrichaceae bacterium]|uniref:Serine protease n=1 Tax=uncultured Thiotrichaceae bacterium TaxID=298394 RepID=A0A6S6SV76_9GAMM|nr:MAG: Serine protease [uncultured Thiotrichaceae bacterium]